MSPAVFAADAAAALVFCFQVSMLYFALWALDKGKHGKQQVQAACRRLVVSTWALVILGCSGSPTLTLDLDFCSSSDHGYTFEEQIDYCSSKRPATNSRDLCHTAVFNSYPGGGVKKEKGKTRDRPVIGLVLVSLVWFLFLLSITQKVDVGPFISWRF